MFHPISECRFAACFRPWGHFVLTDGSRLVGTDLSDAIVHPFLTNIAYKNILLKL
jgi:hypothetical protein